jgi:hypothetical protein
MHKAFSLWAVFAALGLLLWLSSLGIGVHPVYRMTLMIAVFSWAGWFAWDRRVENTRKH